ncbi:MAG: hypothetical protein L6V89_09405 [Oscillospiraceae bacterium]|nr:MAG: hypothetical protein L6V89_09405 [Oscillospiraceae bacterium]
MKISVPAVLRFRALPRRILRLTPWALYDKVTVQAGALPAKLCGLWVDKGPIKYILSVLCRVFGGIMKERYEEAKNRSGAQAADSRSA